MLSCLLREMGNRDIREKCQKYLDHLNKFELGGQQGGEREVVQLSRKAEERTESRAPAGPLQRHASRSGVLRSVILAC